MARPESARTVDVYLTNDELDEGRKAKQTACLKVEREMMVPVACVSRQGASTGAMFTAAEPQRTGRNLTDAEMGMLYDKFVGPASLGSTAVKLEQHERGLTPRSGPHPGSDPRLSGLDSGDRGPRAPSPGMAVAMAAAGSAVRAEALDEHYQEQAASAATMKYVAPHIARKYGVRQHIRPASAVAATSSPYAASAASMAAGRGRPSTAGGGAAAAAAERQQPGASTSDAPTVPAHHLPYGGKPPRPQSAAFMSVSRTKAQTTGSKFVHGGGQDVPHIGKYTPKYGALDKAQHTKDWSKMYGGPCGSTAAAAAAMRRRPGSAPPGGQRSEAGVGAEASVPAAPLAAAAAPKRSMSMNAAALAAQQSQYNAAAAAPPQTAAEAARAQAQARHDELFVGAHPVHERRPEWPAGTQSFKAVGRKPPDTVSTAGHLYGEYFYDGYDVAVRRTARPGSAFQHQIPRPPPTALAPHGDTGPALGPGVYGGEKPLPSTHTGRHVTAGHSSLAHTRDWSRSGPRPGSAPHGRPPSAAAHHQGYWGPDGPAASLFPDAPEYDQLVALKALQDRVQQREDKLHPRRQLQQQQQQPFRQPGIPVPPPPGLAHTGGGGADGAGPFGSSDGRPLVYVGPERYGQYSSTGLAKRVPGGAFSPATREGVAYGMRVMSDNRVTPPANVAVKVVADLTYDYDVAVEGHRGRPPAWQLPPNRNALSQRWVTTAATAYLS